jgi:oligopeptidase A
MDSPPLRETYNANLQKITQYWTELGQNEALFAKYKELQKLEGIFLSERCEKKDHRERRSRFPAERRRASADRKARFAAIQEELAKLSAKFSENVLDATNAFLDHRRRSADTGIPADVLHAAREAAQKDGKEGFKFTLHMPSYMPVMQYADDRALRETLYRESATRASEFGKPEWDNTGNIARIVALRGELSQLLGYATFADVSLVPKMAESPKQVLAFLDDLARRARPFAEKDVAELERVFARPQAWDVAYASEKLRAKRYAFSDQEVKQYFPEDAAIGGLFRVAETLYQVKITPSQAPVWHEDVRFFDVRDAKAPHFPLVGQFYMDLYARETKRGGAWMDDAIGRRRKGGRIQTPVAYLNCNFSRPVAGKPALFTHDEVLTLFHEFGHGLHHLLTRVEDLGVSGINGVEWDAVELPSQFMENFCWEWDVLRAMTRHVDTGAPLPRTLFDKMIAAKNFQSGMGMLRQIEFAEFDYAAAQRIRSRQGQERAGVARKSARARRGAETPCLQPLPQQLLAHLRRRLCRGLLQLQVGGSSLRGRVRFLRGKRHPRREGRRALP